MYCVNGNSSWYSDCGPLFGGCPLLGVSVIGGSTVYYTIDSRGEAIGNGMHIVRSLVPRLSVLRPQYIYA